MKRLFALLLIVLAICCVDARTPHGGAVGSAGGGGFTPQTGFAYSGSTAPGGTMTITSTGNVFGTKPYSGQPLVWAPMDTDMNGSTLGRISGSGTWNTVVNLSWSSSCGPTGSGGCAYGGATKGDGNTGGPGAVYKATAAVDLDAWAGWSSQNSGAGYYWNSYGQQFYMWRSEYHAGFGHLDSSSTNSYNGVGNYNYKDIRWYTRYLGSDNSPDIYWPVHNQRLALETCFQNCAALGITSGAPVQYINSTTTGTPDVNGTLSVQQGFDGMTTGNGLYNQWGVTEMYLQTNTCTTGPNCYAGSSAPNSQFWYWVVGKNGNAPIENWPVSNYQNSTPGVAWMFGDTGSMQSNGQGTLIRVYALQAVVDGTSNCPACSDMPLNAYVNFGPTYVDDCFCHIVVQDSATYTSATAREIQIPATWAAGSITLTLRAGTFGSLHGKYLFVIDSTGSAHLVGSFTLNIVEMPMALPAANDDTFEIRRVA